MQINNALLKVGGSILSKNQNCQNGFFAFNNATRLINLITTNLQKATCVIGGGYLNKWLLNEVSNYSSNIETDDKHYVGISAINVNAEFFRIVFKENLKVNNRVGELYDKVLRYSDLESQELLTSIANKYNYTVVGANKPGHSSDFNAITLALDTGISTIISLKNIDGVYTADPNKDSSATHIPRISWNEYLTLIGATEHEPRGNYPVDPVSAKRAQKNNITFIIVDGEDLNNLKNLLSSKTFKGTIISG